MEINWNHICLYIQFGGTLYFSHAGREHGPTILCVRAAMPPSSSLLLLLLLHHFILPQLEVECANTPPPSSQTGLFNHLNTNPTCLYHTMQVSVSRLDNHTPSPLDPSHQNSSSALLFKNCARTHINIELVFWQLNVKNITISQCFVSCQIQPSFPGGMRSSEFLRVLTRSAIAATKVSL